jgi:hypothetical protein
LAQQLLVSLMLGFALLVSACTKDRYYNLPMS